jgi:hypothetical protein
MASVLSLNAVRSLAKLLSDSISLVDLRSAYVLAYPIHLTLPQNLWMKNMGLQEILTLRPVVDTLWPVKISGRRVCGGSRRPEIYLKTAVRTSVMSPPGARIHRYSSTSETVKRLPHLLPC